MDFSKKKIWVLTDGSQGMISQVVGLAQNFNTNIISIKTKLIFPWSKLQPGFMPIYSWIFLNKIDFLNPPDILISCGRKSVYLSIYMKKKFKNIINIHIQNPKVDFKKFNYIVTPNHDNIKGINVINSIGALHKFNKKEFDFVNKNEFRLPNKNLCSVIIGGNNHHYKFLNKEADKLVSHIKKIMSLNSQLKFLILFSRRTTLEIKNIIKLKLQNEAYIWDEKQKNPYTYALKYSDWFIVTSDSTSMISECAITNKPIYVFHLPFKRDSKRIKNFHMEFENLKITKTLDKANDLIPWQYNTLNESERIASIIKERIIKEN